MKRTILFLLAVTTALSCLFAQTTKNPFSELGYKKQITYTSSKGEFEEFHDKTDVVEIGSVYFNTKTNKVVGYVNEEKEKAEVATAISAMSIDPMCEKYYWISPYAYCLNNPVKYVDPTGMVVEKPINLFDEADSETLQNVPKNADYEVGDGKFTVYAHANGKGVQYTDKNGNLQLANTPEAVVQILSERSPEFKEAMKADKDISITIYGCNAASEEYISHNTGQMISVKDPIVKQMTEKYDNITATGANGFVIYGTSYWGTPEVRGVTNHNNNGAFITYKDGKVIDTTDANYNKPVVEKKK